MASNTIPAMLHEAENLVGYPYSWGGGHGKLGVASGNPPGFDCSGFVSAVLGAAGIVKSPQTTQTIVQAGNLVPGAGKVTVWDRRSGAEHVIINIDGNWFESGGNSANNPGGGVGRITPAGAANELAGGGFDPFHPASLGGTTQPDTLSNLWIEAGGSPALSKLMAAIAMAESGGVVNRTSPQNTNGTYDYGLWQINSSHNYDKNRLLTDPLYNAQAAVAIEKSQGLTAWTTYNKGLYVPFLNTAASRKIDYGGPSGGYVRPGGAPGSAPSVSGGGGGGGGGASSNSAIFTGYESLKNTDRGPAPPGQSASGFLGSIGSSVGWFMSSFIPGANQFESVVSSPFGIIGSAEDFFSVLTAMLNPRNWLRAVEFVTGIGFMAYGLNLMMRTGAGGRRSSVTQSFMEAGAREHRDIISKRQAARKPAKKTGTVKKVAKEAPKLAAAA
jgi:Lysozyme like domain/NlpC/P60 family